MDSDRTPTLTRRVILALFFGGLMLLSYKVLQPFLVPAAWAGIIAYVTWPLHVRLRTLLRGRDSLSALLMSLLLATAFVLPLLLMAGLLRVEATTAYQALAARLAQGPIQLPEFLQRIPWLGEQLQGFLLQLGGDRESLKAQLAQWVEPALGQLGQIAGGVGRNLAKLGFALLTVFFLYRDGERVIDQFHQVLRRMLGDRVERYLAATGNTTRAVVYGIVLTALVQGLLAGIGYWGAGVNAPVLLAVLTALLALVPFGTPVVWGSVGLWLLFGGDTVAGIGLLLWGGLVVSSVDNVIRPIVISGATRIPFLLVLFGVLGGLAAFGLIGLFLGPVILAVLMAVWQEWLEEQVPEH
ncbi:MAG: AI-2E family transporter [Betaproteobacteria bacterium]|nr:AI-2E family transporter [Betaproteobacteria bacterium]